jgi:multiple sugar transport system permease protein/sn-glycerol 3-phosphate transport system permease protein
MATLDRVGPSARPTALERREWVLFVLLVAPNLFLFGVFTFWPLIENVRLSFVQWDMLSPVQRFVGLDNYSAVLSAPDFGLVLFNSLYLTAGTTVLCMAIGLATALLLNQPLRGRDAARAVLFSPVVLSGAAVAIVWSYLFDPRFGLIDAVLGLVGLNSPAWLTSTAWAMPAVILVFTWKNFGYSMVVFLAGLKTIPHDLYEAARVDGANAWERFIHVTLPGLSPVMFFLVLTNTLTSFQAFDIINILTDGGPVNASQTLIYSLYEAGFQNFDAGEAGVISVVLFVLMFAFTVLQMRTTEDRVHYN